MNFKKGLFISFAVHIALIIFVIIKVSFFSKPEVDLSEAIRVDMVGLPEKYTKKDIAPLAPKEEKKPETLPEKVEPPKPPPEPTPPPKPEPKPVKADKDAVNVNKSKKKQQVALEKLKAMSAIEKIRKEVQQQDTAKPIKGRVITKGTSLTGLDKMQSDSYLVQLDGLIKSHWQLPQWLIGKPYKTKVLVKFDPDGRLIDKKIYQTSGNPTYDEYCLQAIDHSSPFPKVPERFSEVYKEDGVLIGFPE